VGVEKAPNGKVRAAGLDWDEDGADLVASQLPFFYRIRLDDRPRPGTSRPSFTLLISDEACAHPRVLNSSESIEDLVEIAGDDAARFREIC